MITKKVKGRLCIWMTTKIKQEMNIRDKLLPRARRTKAENDWSSYKRQRNNVTSLVKKVKNNYFRDLQRENVGNHKNSGQYLKKPSQLKKFLIILAQHSISKENKQQISLLLRTSSVNIFPLLQGN